MRMLPRKSLAKWCLVLGKLMPQPQMAVTASPVVLSPASLCAGPGPISSDQLPPVPPPPASVNLDVTTLCALVSELTNADPTRADLWAWAARTSHWRVRHASQLLRLLLAV